MPAHLSHGCRQVGVIGIILTVVWWIVRSVKGLQAASHREAIADPRSYGW